MTTPTRSTWVAFPFAFGNLDKPSGTRTGGVLPLALWKRSPEHSWTAIPVLLTYRMRQGEDRVAVYGPFIKSNVGGRRKVAFVPLFLYQRDAESTSFASLPFIYWRKRGEYSQGFVGLAYWNQETGTRISPLYVRWAKYDSTRTLTRSVEVAPFFVRYHSPDKDVLVIGPWYRMTKSDGYRIVGVAPLFSKTSGPGPHAKSWSVLGDLIGHEQVTGTGPDGLEHVYTRWNFLWLLHTNHVDQTEKATTRRKEESIPPAYVEN